MPWPLSFGQAVGFAAQIPLKLAVEARLIPLEVNPETILTVFWGEGWPRPLPCTAPAPAGKDGTILNPSPPTANGKSKETDSCRPT